MSRNPPRSLLCVPGLPLFHHLSCPRRPVIFSLLSIYNGHDDAVPHNPLLSTDRLGLGWISRVNNGPQINRTPRWDGLCPTPSPATASTTTVLVGCSVHSYIQFAVQNTFLLARSTATQAYLMQLFLQRYWSA